MKKRSTVLKTVLAALFLALAYIMPYLTGQIPEVGSMLCPMHIPVLVCGFVCGWQWGLVVGFVSPLLRSMLTGGFPPMFPTAVCMAFELAAYGAVAGALHKAFPRKKRYIYCSLLLAMLVGRVVWGVSMYLCLLAGGGFTFSAFIAGAVLNAVPGIIAQIVLVPMVVIFVDRRRIGNAE